MTTKISVFLAVLVGWLFSITAVVAETRYVEGEVIVTFKPAATTEAASAALQRKSLAFTERFRGLSLKRQRETGLVRDRAKTTAQLIAALRDDPSVETVEPNYLRHLSATPNDTRFGEMWALRNTGQTVDGVAGTPAADVKFLDARALSRTPLGEIVVGVLDTGVDWVHPDLLANVWTNPLEIPGNGVDDDGNGYADDVHGYDFADNDADPSDSDEHGTHVAGTIAAVGDNQMGVIGVDDQVRILPLKVSSDGDTIDTAASIRALQYATALKVRGVNIVALNASYGGGGSSSAESAAIQAAGQAGIILCVAAGNETANNDTTPSYPASYRLPNMIVVAATTQTDALASYSNYGATTVDLAAPGSNILSTRPSTVTFQAGGITYLSDAMEFGGVTPGLTGNIIDCGTGNTAAEFPTAVQGQIALMQRGTEDFAVKVAHAMAAGAKAAIIYNNVTAAFTGTLQAPGRWIPTRTIARADGLAIKAALPKTGAFVVTGNYQFLDGTSMATPHVAGAVAFAAMNFPGDTMAQRRQRLLASVDVKPALQGKMVTNGRLNLLRIVDANANGVADWQPVVTTLFLNPAVIDEFSTQTLAATGGTAPYTWSLAAGTLPGDLTLSNSGTLSGTSHIAGDFSMTVRATDHFGAAGTRQFNLRVAAHGPLHHFRWDYAPPTAYAGFPFAVKITARDASERLVVTAVGNLALSGSGGSGSFVITPASVPLAAGVFLGRISCPAAGSGLLLTATQNSITGASSSLTVLDGTSTAADGLPDAWKTAHHLSPAENLATVDTVDTDHDGQTDRQEFTAGTDPQSPASTFRILSTETDAQTYFTLYFNGLAGQWYRVSSSNHTLTAWTPLPLSTLLPTTTGLQTVTIPLSGSPAAAFFRVEIVP